MKQTFHIVDWLLKYFFSFVFIVTVMGVTEWKYMYFSNIIVPKNTYYYQNTIKNLRYQILNGIFCIMVVALLLTAGHETRYY